MTEPLPFEIQTAGWRDLNELRVLEVECFAQDAWPLWDLIAALTLPGLVRIKAVVDGQMAGFVGGDPRPDDDTGWITTLGVHEAYRRKGIAAALLVRCEEEMALPKIRLCVRRTNQPALLLYTKMGYQIVDCWQKYYVSGEDAYVLEKKR